MCWHILFTLAELLASWPLHWCQTIRPFTTRYTRLICFTITPVPILSRAWSLCFAGLGQCLRFSSNGHETSYTSWVMDCTIYFSQGQGPLKHRHESAKHMAHAPGHLFTMIIFVLGHVLWLMVHGVKRIVYMLRIYWCRCLLWALCLESISTTIV